MKIVDDVRLITRLMGGEGVMVMFLAMVMTLGVLNFCWVMVSPADAFGKALLFALSLGGGILLFGVICLLILVVMLPWMLHRKINKFFGPVIRMNQEYEKRRRIEEKGGMRAPEEAQGPGHIGEPMPEPKHLPSHAAPKKAAKGKRIKIK